MDSLPGEVLVKIFELLDSKDILRLTTLCKHFNNVIGSHKELFSKLNLIIDHVDSSLELTRRYSSVKIRGLYGIEEILEKIGHDVTSLSFIDTSSWQMDKHAAALKLCPDLKHLIFKHIPRPGRKPSKYDDVHEDYDDCGNVHYVMNTYSNEDDINRGFYDCEVEKFEHLSDEDLPKYKNLHLELINVEEDFLIILKNCTVKKFFYDMNSTRHAVTVIEFLSQQNDLEDLTLVGEEFGMIAGKKIFDDDSLSKMNFRLKKLTLKKFDIAKKSGEYQKKYLNFVKLHANSLQHLKVEFDLKLDFYTQFINLKSLKITGNYAKDQIDKTFPNILHLEVVGQLNQKLIDAFPNLKCLKIDSSWNLTSIESETVEELMISRTKVEKPLKFPALKKIHLRSVSPIPMQIFAPGCKVETIIVEKCSQMSEDEKIAIRKNCENLKVFVEKYERKI